MPEPGRFGTPAPEPAPPTPDPVPPGQPGPNQVIIPAAPAYYAVPWHKSQKFKAYVSAEVLLVIGWLIENLTQMQQPGVYHWTWVAVSTSSLTLLGAVVKDWASPAVVAPFSALNTKNYPTLPVPET